jgi:4-hydroxyphenylpyruvate dioxygenase
MGDRRHTVAALAPNDAKPAAWPFLRARLGLEPRGVLEIPDPYGLIRRRAIFREHRSVRLMLNVAQGRTTVMARSLSTSSD